jgi:uncharacterized protein (DUF849 family)
MRKLSLPIIFIVILLLFDYSYALTPQEVIRLKKAGVSEKTIQLMIQQETEAREKEAYDRIGMREIKDKNGNAYVIYSTGDSTIDLEEREKVENAWKMLQNMVIEKGIKGR